MGNDGRERRSVEEACARLAARRKQSLPPRVSVAWSATLMGTCSTRLLPSGKDLTSVSGKVITNGKDIAQSIHSVFNLIART